MTLERLREHLDRAPARARLDLDGVSVPVTMGWGGRSEPSVASASAWILGALAAFGLIGAASSRLTAAGYPGGILFIGGAVALGLFALVLVASNASPVTSDLTLRRGVVTVGQVSASLAGGRSAVPRTPRRRSGSRAW